MQGRSQIVVWALRKSTPLNGYPNLIPNDFEFFIEVNADTKSAGKINTDLNTAQRVAWAYQYQRNKNRQTPQNRSSKIFAVKTDGKYLAATAPERAYVFVIEITEATEVIIKSQISSSRPVSLGEFDTNVPALGSISREYWARNGINRTKSFQVVISDFDFLFAFNCTTSFEKGGPLHEGKNKQILYREDISDSVRVRFVNQLQKILTQTSDSKKYNSSTNFTMIATDNRGTPKTKPSRFATRNNNGEIETRRTQDSTVFNNQGVESDRAFQASSSQIDGNIATEPDQTAPRLFTKITDNPEVVYDSKFPPKELLGFTPKIYMPHELEALLHAQNHTQMIAGKEYICVRYLVRMNGIIVFGQEGYPNETIPAHYQLVGQEITNLIEVYELTCLAAGNAYFDMETYELAGLSNKSGDFKPPFNSMQFALHALFAEGIRMQQQLMIFKLNRNSPEADYTVNTNQLKTEINSLGLPQRTTPKLTPPPPPTPPPEDHHGMPQDLLISEPAVQEASAKQRFKNFWAAHWKKILACALIGSLLVVAGVFTAGIVPMIAAGLGVGLATAAGIGFGGAAAVGALAGVGVGAIAGAVPTQEESGVKSFLSRHKWKIVIGAILTVVIVGGILTGGVLAALGVAAGLGALAAGVSGGVAATMGAVGVTVSTTAATAIGATVATVGVATVGSTTGFVLGAIMDNSKTKKPQEPLIMTQENSGDSTKDAPKGVPYPANQRNSNDGPQIKSKYDNPGIYERRR